jgi:hypothetical protein
VIQVVEIERAVGLPRVIEAVGPEKLLDEMQAQMPAEQFQEMLRRRQQG